MLATMCVTWYILLMGITLDLAWLSMFQAVKRVQDKPHHQQAAYHDKIITSLNGN